MTSIFNDRGNKQNIFSDRGVKPKNNTRSEKKYEEDTKKVSGIQASSMMQGIITIKEENERKAAGIVSDYMKVAAVKTFDERVLLNELSKLLTGFTTEEQNRILMKAFIITLLDIS